MKVGTVVVVVHVSPAVSMHIPAVEASIHGTCQPPRDTTCSSFHLAHLRSHYTCLQSHTPVQSSLVYLLLQYNFHLTCLVSWRINSRPRSGSLGGKELGRSQQWSDVTTPGSKCGGRWELSLATAALHQSLSYSILQHIGSRYAGGEIILQMDFLPSNLLLLHIEECHNMETEGDAAAAVEPEPPPQL